MKNKLFALLLVVFAAFTFSSAANAQSHGHGGFAGGGHVYNGGNRVNNGGGGRVGGYDRSYDRSFDHGYNRGYDRGYGYRDYGYRGFGYGFGFGYLLAPRYYDAPVYVAPAPELYVDQYGREYYLDADGYAVFTGRIVR